MNPFEGQKRKREMVIPYAALGDTLSYNVQIQLRQKLSPEDFKALAKLKLDDPEIRNTFVNRHLADVSAAIDAGDDERAVLALEILAAGLNSLVPVREGDKSFPGPGVQKESSGIYKTYLGSGTRGQRIMLAPDDETKRYEWMRFPSDTPGISKDFQDGFKNLYGDRVVAYTGLDPENPELYAPIRADIPGLCPCGSRKKYKKCHGAGA